MNNSQVAKNGFKTFIVTLTVSLVLFSILYYFVTGSSKEIDIEQQDLQVSKPTAVASVVPAVAAAKEESVFYDLSQAKVNDSGEAVLAGATESTSTVPNTGITQVTWGFFMSLVALGLGGYLVFLGPRKTAIAHFEKKVFKDLD